MMYLNKRIGCYRNSYLVSTIYLANHPVYKLPNCTLI